ncbi:hypothetical protein IWW56_005606 [Coemansia sp. RSA 2131]|nr:hypothetical protein IWW56_005606 [Coemansia sp. RSA 2131]
MYPMPIPSRTPSAAISQHSAPGYLREPAWHGGEMFSKSMPAPIPIPGSHDIGPHMSQMRPDSYNYETQGHYRQHRRQTNYPPLQDECGCGCNSGYGMSGYVHSVPHHSLSPLLLEPSCSCCPPQPYNMHHSYYEPESLCGSVPMSMPIQMPAPMSYTPASMPAYAHQARQKPRKRVTFADPIAEIKVVPCHASSAPEYGVQASVESFPTRPHASSRRSDINPQMLESSYGSQPLAGALNMLTSSYSLHPRSSKSSSHKSSSHSSSKHKKRSSICSTHVETDTLYGTNVSKPSAQHKSHERRKSDYSGYAKSTHALPGYAKSTHTLPGYAKSAHALPGYAYDERFSLSMAHLPLKTQPTSL